MARAADFSILTHIEFLEYNDSNGR
jgi:hypothetical protein